MNPKQRNGMWLALPLLLLGAIVTSAAPAPEVADAVRTRNASALQSLLKQRADVNAAQPDGTTALHWAAHWNDAETVNLLLRAGANAKAVNRYGATPLSEAVSAGSPAMIQSLLNAGADPKTLTTRGRRDGPDDGCARGEYRRCPHSSGSRRRCECERELQGADCSDVGCRRTPSGRCETAPGSWRGLENPLLR